MESLEAYRARKQLIWINNNICKNGTSSIIQGKIISIGCKNKRRHGSKFCQECSDKHKQTT